jgi:rod shape-determining protein MreD
VIPLPILLSLVLAMALSIVPLPAFAEPLRPDWVLLVLVYWSMAFPRLVGIFTAAGVGLFMDILHQQLLGQHSLVLALILFIVLQIYPLLRVFPVWQQAIVIAVLVLVARLLHIWILGASGILPGSSLYWSPVLTSALLWPLVYHLLRDTRRRWLLHLT